MVPAVVRRLAKYGFCKLDQTVACTWKSLGAMGASSSPAHIRAPRPREIVRTVLRRRNL